MTLVIKARFICILVLTEKMLLIKAKFCLQSQMPKSMHFQIDKLYSEGWEKISR